MRFGGRLGRCHGLEGDVVEDADDESVVHKRYFMESVESLEQEKDFNNVIDLIHHEARQLRELSHPHLLSLVSSCVVSSHVLLTLPRMRFGSVRDALNGHFNEGLPEPILASVARDVLKALVYLHHKGMVHRSIRCSHFLLDSDGSVRLSGLRYCCTLRDAGRLIEDRYDYSLHVAKTNLCYMSPEMLQQNLLGYNEKTDIYSLAIAMCEAGNGAVPFAHMPNTLMLLEKLRGASPIIIDATTFDPTNAQHNNGHVDFGSGRPADSGVGVSMDSSSNFHHRGTNNCSGGRPSTYRSRQFTSHLHNFVAICSALDAFERPSAAQLLSHPLIKTLKKTVLSLSTLLDPMKANHEAIQSEENLKQERGESFQWLFEAEEI